MCTSTSLDTTCVGYTLSLSICLIRRRPGCYRQHATVIQPAAAAAAA